MLCCRADYISLLSDNTLSLDGIASLNAELRSLVNSETWNKQEHVHWVAEKMFELFGYIKSIL